MTEPGSDHEVLARAASHGRDPKRLRADLVEAAMRGLAYSGTPEAARRLADLATESVSATDPGTQRRRSAALTAVRLYNQLHRDGSSSTFDQARVSTSGGGEIGLDGIWGVLDDQARVHDAGLTYANHPDVPSPMTDIRLDEVLDLASLRSGRGDDADDVACCTSVSRSGTAGTFGASGDGLDVISDSADMSAVLNDAAARVKVVRAIDYCGGPGFNISGCAWAPGKGIAVVRLGGLGHEAVLWLHEYGHNTGLSHSSNGSRYIMYSVDYGTNSHLTQAECDTYHAPHAVAYMTPTDTGACTDVDADVVQDVIDNCPGVANHDQADSEGEGKTANRTAPE